MAEFNGANKHRIRVGLRRCGALLGSGVLAVGLLATPASAAVRSAEQPTAATHAAATTWPIGGIGDLFDGQEYGAGPGGAQGSSSRDGVDSEAATADESTGVVLIDTALYSGAAGAGTGIVLTSSGRVLTNYHVVENSTAIEVTVASTGQSYTAEVVGADESSDVAVLQLAGANGLDVAAVDDDQVAVGEDVTAVGNAGGTGELTAADGEVTALNAEITTASEDGTRGETLQGLIETDADVVAGDSGGPLIDDEGEVVGIDTAASTGADIDGYAIPIDDALAIVSQIDSGQQSDQVRIGPAAYLGVSVSDMVRTGSQPGYRGDEYGNGGQATVDGAGVVGTTDGSPAADAGLTEGSVITSVNSTAVDSAEGLTEVLQQYRPGDQVRLSWVDASGAEHTETVTLGESPIN